jgi:NitT/TauT family transport system permease protein
VFVVAIVQFALNPDIWLSPLIILGTQWYILFNVIAGSMAYPNDFREAAANFRMRGWQWWRQVMLPGIFPYFVTGAITAARGAWNASIVAEAVSWGDTKITAHGLGAYIAENRLPAIFRKSSSASLSCRCWSPRSTGWSGGRSMLMPKTACVWTENCNGRIRHFA